jgi:two-component system LytT family sensor kinase
VGEGGSYRKLGTVYALHAVFWVVLHVFVFHHLGFSWKIALVDSAVNNSLLFALCFATGFTLRYYNPAKRNRFMLFGWSIALAAICSCVSNVLLSKIFEEDATYIFLLDKSFSIRFCIAFLILGWVILFSWIVNGMKASQENFSRKTDAENLLREAELTGLRQQLQPHFLFNSLNSISALAGSRPEEARKMIQQLSDFLRGTLKKDDQQMLSLEEELNHLQLYLDIEKVRFGHRLSTLVNTQEESLNMMLPPLLLQPIVENAIKFGLYDTTDNVNIQITTKIENNHLVISITNPFDIETAQPNQGTGFGLKSVQRRLYLLFFRNDLLQTTIKDNLYTTTVIIPQKV